MAQLRDQKIQLSQSVDLYITCYFTVDLKSSRPSGRTCVLLDESKLFGAVLVSRPQCYSAQVSFECYLVCHNLNSEIHCSYFEYMARLKKRRKENRLCAWWEQMLAVCF